MKIVEVLAVALAAVGIVAATCETAAAQPRSRTSGAWTTRTYKYGRTARQNLIAQYAGGTTGRPWVLSIHGGGWVSQDATTMKPADDLFNAHGYDTFAVNYDLLTTRGVTEYTLRYEIRKAVSWVRAHAQTFGIDPDRGALYGYSAGGQLALLIGLADRRIKAVLTTSAIAEPARVADDHHGLRPATEPDNPFLAGLYPNEVIATGGCQWPTGNAIAMSALCRRRWADFTPSSVITAESPPALLFSGTADEFHTAEQADAFCYWMRYGGHRRPCTSRHVVGYPHGQGALLLAPARGLAFLRARLRVRR